MEGGFLLQEEIENKTVAISVQAAKLTGKVLAKACAAAYRKIQKDMAENAKRPQGRQSVKRLTGRYDAKTMPLNEDTKLFDQVIKEKNLKVDYAFMPNGPGKHLLLFKAAQIDTITAAFAEYTSRYMARSKEKRPSIKKELEKHGKRERTRTKPPKELKREAVRIDR